jgi:thiol-disulfide isomerase/thioredoxin
MSLPARVRAAAAASFLVAVAGLTQSAVPASNQMQSFEGNAGWINSDPLTPEQLRGKVVLVDFWEYTCINCLRTLPYLREWYKRYRDKGFVIVGVHTPEFGFSGERANVAAAAKRLEVTWPIALDPKFVIWKRYDNSIWPHEYLYNQRGELVESVIGEGAYPQTEARIQALLKAADPKVVLPPVMALLPQDSYDKPGAVCYPMTAEILVGHQGVANPASVNPGQNANYVGETSDPKDGAIYLRGYWRLTPEAALSGESSGSLTLRYHAIQVIAVIKPDNGSSTPVEVTQNGHPIAKSDAGKDIRYDERGMSYVTVDAPRAYDLIMNAKFGTNTLQLSPKGGGIGFYDFAFESCEVPGSRG